MCVLIYKPEGIILDEADLLQAWVENPDGAGIAYRLPDGQITIKKGVPYSWEDFLHHYEPVEDLELIIHFRWASQGRIAPINAHPVPIVGGALAHNGHIAGYGSKDVSDTRHWTDTVLAPVLAKNPYALQDTRNRQKLEKILGWNKLALMMPHQSVVLVNEHKGIWDSGTWYSNQEYRKSIVDAYTDSLFQDQHEYDMWRHYERYDDDNV